MPAEVRRRAFRDSAVARKCKAGSQFRRTLGTEPSTKTGDASDARNSQVFESPQSGSVLAPRAAITRDGTGSPALRRGRRVAKRMSGSTWSPVNVAVGIKVAKLWETRRELVLLRAKSNASKGDDGESSDSMCYAEAREGASRRALDFESLIEGVGIAKANHGGTPGPLVERNNNNKDRSKQGDRKDRGYSHGAGRGMGRSEEDRGRSSSPRVLDEELATSPIKYGDNTIGKKPPSRKTSQPTVARPKTKPPVLPLHARTPPRSNRPTLPPTITVATVNVPTSAATTLTGGLTSASSQVQRGGRKNKPSTSVKRHVDTPTAASTTRVVRWEMDDKPQFADTANSKTAVSSKAARRFESTAKCSLDSMPDKTAFTHEHSSCTRSPASYGEASVVQPYEPIGTAAVRTKGHVRDNCGRSARCQASKDDEQQLLHLHECVWKAGYLVKRTNASPVARRVAGQ